MVDVERLEREDREADRQAGEDAVDGAAGRAVRRDDAVDAAGRRGQRGRDGEGPGAPVHRAGLAMAGRGTTGNSRRCRVALLSFMAIHRFRNPNLDAEKKGVQA
jgi:hypothetical protein